MKPLLFFALMIPTLVAHAQQKIVFQPEYAPMMRYITFNHRSTDTKITVDKGDTVLGDTLTRDKANEIMFISTMKTGLPPKTGRLSFHVQFSSTQKPKSGSPVYRFAAAKGTVGPYGQLSYDTVSAAIGDEVTYKSPFMKRFEDELGWYESTVLSPMDTGSWYTDTVKTRFPFGSSYVAATIIVTHTLTSITGDTARFEKDIEVIIDPKSPKLPLPVHGAGNGNGYTTYNWKDRYIMEDETNYTYELRVNTLINVMHVTTNVYAQSTCIAVPTDGNLDF